MKSIFDYGVLVIKDLNEHQLAELEVSEVRELKLKGVHEVSGLHDALALVLKFPTWYGKNLDALNDLLTDLPDEARIVVKVSRKEWDGIQGSYGFESSFKLATKGSGGIGYGRGKILLLKV